MNTQPLVVHVEICRNTKIALLLRLQPVTAESFCSHLCIFILNPNALLWLLLCMFRLVSEFFCYEIIMYCSFHSLLRCRNLRKRGSCCGAETCQLGTVSKCKVLRCGCFHSFLFLFSLISIKRVARSQPFWYWTLSILIAAYPRYVYYIRVSMD